jgi:hypothetical protein
MTFGTRDWGLVLGAFVISAALGCSSSSSSSSSSGNTGGTGGGTSGGGTSGATGGHTGTGGTSGGTFTTSVPASTKLNAITSAQATQLCADLSTYVQTALIVPECKLLAVEFASFGVTAGGTTTDADLQAACAQVYDGCLHPDGGTSTSTSTCDPTSLQSEPSTCPATVGDFTTCLDDTSAGYQQAAAATPDCDKLTSASLAAFLASLPDGGSPVTEPASCTKFDAACPGMSASMSTTTKK